MTTARVTIKDIAREAGCAIGTVSDIINRNETHDYSQKTVARVRDVAAKIGYVHHTQASSLRTGKTHVIGVTHSFLTQLQAGFNNPYVTQVYAGVGSALAGKDYNLLFHNVTGVAEQTGDPTDLIRSRQADGLIYIYFSNQQERFENEHAPLLRNTGLPVVVIHSTDRDFPFANVGLDSAQGGYLAATHLIQHGYDQVGLVCHEQTRGLHRAFLAGYEKALKEHGRAVDDSIIYRVGPNTTHNGMALVRDVLCGGGTFPRALFVTEDATAYGMMRALAEAGVRVPEDVAIVGFGDYYNEAHIVHTLTSVVQPAFRKGQAAARILLKLLGDPDQVGMAGTVVFEPELRTRTSCGCE
ncbi:MAG: LacI family DNA-binding transcriptional regulator [Chitinivibrionales bacterium]|nr:LacI family DNA-binding transcriptional regulator [Chitinivibrionales bacterium]